MSRILGSDRTQGDYRRLRDAFRRPAALELVTSREGTSAPLTGFRSADQFPKAEPPAERTGSPIATRLGMSSRTLTRAPFPGGVYLECPVLRVGRVQLGRAQASNATMAEQF